MAETTDDLARKSLLETTLMIGIHTDKHTRIQKQWYRIEDGFITSELLLDVTCEFKSELTKNSDSAHHYHTDTYVIHC